MSCRLSIVVVSWNTRALTLRCLASLEATVRTPFELIVVDNASSDGSARAVRKAYAGAIVLETGANLGFGAGANRGIARARGPYVLLLNPDAIVEPGAIDALVDHLDAHPEAAACGPRILSTDGRLQPSAHRFYSTGWSLVENRLVERWPWRYRRSPVLTLFSHDVTRRVDWVSGACLMVRRAAFEAIGGFDETFWMYGEEVDWQKRAARRGLQVHFVATARIVHEGGGAARLYPDRLCAAERASRRRLIAKHHGPLTLAIYDAKAKMARAVWRILGN